MRAFVAAGLGLGLYWNGGRWGLVLGFTVPGGGSSRGGGKGGCYSPMCSLQTPLSASRSLYGMALRSSYATTPPGDSGGSNDRGVEGSGDKGERDSSSLYPEDFKIPDEELVKKLREERQALRRAVNEWDDAITKNPPKLKMSETEVESRLEMLKRKAKYPNPVTRLIPKVFSEEKLMEPWDNLDSEAGMLLMETASKLTDDVMPSPWPDRIYSSDNSLQEEGLQMPLGFSSLKPPIVALTREAGRNNHVSRALSGIGISNVEIPCTGHGITDQFIVCFNELRKKHKEYAWIVLTSPYAVRVFSMMYIAASRPKVRIACLGPGTAKELKEALNLEADWVGQTALATEMAKNLPKDVGHVVMHPTSTAADEALKIGLEDRGFRVNRFEVYDTRAVAWNGPMQITAKACLVVALASPSAAAVWASYAGTGACVVAMGPKTAETCHTLGWTRAQIFYSASPSLANFVENIMDCVSYVRKTSASIPSSKPRQLMSEQEIREEEERQRVEEEEENKAMEQYLKVQELAAAEENRKETVNAIE